MDVKSELELKFDADQVSVGSFLTLVGQTYGEAVQSYKVVSGTDNYYRQGENRLRHRCDGQRKTSTLTWKGRKSAESITDRHEIDMPIDPSLRGGTLVDDFLTNTGWEHHFGIAKTSYIFHILDEDPGVVICVALYEVQKLPREFETAPRRFLEIEIEKDSTCSPEDGLKVLDKHAGTFRDLFCLSGPLNQSLSEIYAPKESP